jgi:hypothetical protein
LTSLQLRSRLGPKLIGDRWTLVANGDNDTMMITENSYLLAHHLPNAQLRIYGD